MHDKKIHFDAFKGVITELYKFEGEPKVSVSRAEYELFCKEYLFDKLKGVPFGRAFCKRFNIEDRAISNLISEKFTKELIETLGYIK